MELDEEACIRTELDMMGYAGLDHLRFSGAEHARLPRALEDKTKLPIEDPQEPPRAEGDLMRFEQSFRHRLCIKNIRLSRQLKTLGKC